MKSNKYKTMKKLILIIVACTIAGMVSGQTILRKKTQNVITALDLSTVTTAADTSIWFYFPADANTISVEMDWTYTAGSGNVYIDVSNSGTYWAKFDTTSYDSYSSADTTFLWDNNSIPITWERMRFRFDTARVTINNCYLRLTK